MTWNDRQDFSAGPICSKRALRGVVRELRKVAREAGPGDRACFLNSAVRFAETSADAIMAQPALQEKLLRTLESKGVCRV